MSKPALMVKLQISISALLLCLMLPALFACVAYVYQSNYAIYIKHATDLIDRHGEQTTSNLKHMLNPLRDSLMVLRKQIEDDPSTFYRKELRETLLLHLNNNPDLISVFIASDNGNFRQVQKIKGEMLVAGRLPPPDAKFNYWTVDRVAGREASSIFSFYKSHSELLDSFTVQNKYDPRERPFYKNLVASLGKADNNNNNAVFIDEPFIATSTRRATLTASIPIKQNKNFIGMIGESFEIEAISIYLASIAISKNSQSYVIDSNGTVIVGTGLQNGHTVKNNVLVKQNLNDLDGSPAQIAFKNRLTTSKGLFEFEYGTDKAKYLAQFTPFENEFNKDWALLTVVPLGDLLGSLQAVNEQLIFYGLLFCALLILFAFYGTKLIARPIEQLTHEIHDLVNFEIMLPAQSVRSRIQEISILSDAIGRLRSAVMAFTAYVPRDLVNDLLKSGNAITVGGESRYMTIFFTDLKDFSALSETVPSRELLECVSSYLELVTYAIKEEAGTVDKFIGDSVMAFWGAPVLNQHHAYHACVSAIKSQRRMAKLNDRLLAEGRPALSARIGIHSDAVLVGNIGSTERLSYTVMGDGVNVASRLEGINKEFSTQICVSHAVYKEAGERLWTRPIDHITVKGRKGTVLIYELLGIRDGDEETRVTEQDQQLCLATHKAFALLAGQRFTEAAEAYQSIIDSSDDGLAKVMQRVCLERARSGLQ